MVSAKKKIYKKKMVTNLRFFLIGNSSDLTPTSVKLKKISVRKLTTSLSFFCFFFFVFFFFGHNAIYPLDMPFEEMLVKTRPVIIHIQEFVIDRCQL